MALFVFNFQNDRLAVLAAGSARGHMGDRPPEGAGGGPEVYYPDRCDLAENRTGERELTNRLECMNLYNQSFHL